MDKKKILFVTARMPFPAKEGHQLRSSGVLAQLSKQFDVHLFSFMRSDDIQDIAPYEEYSTYCKSVSYTPLKSDLFTHISTLGDAFIRGNPVVVSKFTNKASCHAFIEALEQVKPDLVHFDLLPLCGLRKFLPNDMPVVLNEHNIEYHLVEQKLATAGNPLMKYLFKRELRLLTEFEIHSCINVSAVLACSDADTDEIKQLGQKLTFCIPNGVDVKKFLNASDEVDTNRLVFLGGMSWFPNRLGMQWFINDILPDLLKKRPEIVVDVVGNPEPALDIPDHLNKHVNILGFVDDFRPVVNKASIMIVPLQIGSGTRLKIVEGGAMSKCMVSTRKGAEGINLEHNKSIVLADTAEEFSASIDRVLASPDAITNTGTEALKVISSTYDWDAIGMALDSIYKKVINRDKEKDSQDAIKRIAS